MEAYLLRALLSTFTDWLDSQSIAHRPGKGEYQALQVKRPSGWEILYSSPNYPDHYKAGSTQLAELVREFNADRK
jgi:hypothetical protein